MYAEHNDSGAFVPLLLIISNIVAWMEKYTGLKMCVSFVSKEFNVTFIASINI
jgi:hypothetical protein